MGGDPTHPRFGGRHRGEPYNTGPPGAPLREGRGPPVPSRRRLRAEGPPLQGRQRPPAPAPGAGCVPRSIWTTPACLAGRTSTGGRHSQIPLVEELGVTQRAARHSRPPAVSGCNQGSCLSHRPLWRWRYSAEPFRPPAPGDREIGSCRRAGEACRRPERRHSSTGRRPLPSVPRPAAPKPPRGGVRTASSDRGRAGTTHSHDWTTADAARSAATATPRTC